MSIAVSHSIKGVGGYGLVNQHSAVMLFFVISGFYMAMIYENYKDSFGRFYLNRFLRLFPTFYFVIFYMLLVRNVLPHPSIAQMLLLLLTWAFVYYVIVLLIIEYLGIPIKFNNTYSRQIHSTVRKLIFSTLEALHIGTRNNLKYLIGIMVVSVLAASTYILLEMVPPTLAGAFAVLANTTMIGADVIYTFNYIGVPLAPIAVHLLIQPTWSVGIEEQYYLISPLFHKVNLQVIFMVFAASILVRFLIDHYFLMPASGTVVFGLSYSTLPPVLVFFLFGHLAFLLYREIKDLEWIKWIGWVSAIIILLWFVFDVSQGQHDSSFFGWHFYSDIWGLSFHRGGTYGDLISYIPFIFFIPFWFHISRRSKIDRFLGNLSYPLYISHVFVIASVIQVKGWPRDVSPSEDVIILAVCLVVAAFLTVFVEGEIRPLRDHVRGFAR